MKHRLQAAYDIVNGRVPKGMAVTSPFFYGAMNYGGAKGNITAPRNRMTVEKLRRFSETSIPRRFVNYYRNQIAMLDWWLVPKEGVTPNQQHEKRMRQVTKLLAQPNADADWNTFVELVIEEMCVVGIAPVEVKTLRQREISDAFDSTSDNPRHALFPFDGSSLQYVMDWDGSPSAPRYVQMLPDGKVTPFTNSEIIPMRLTARTNTPHGLGPMEVAYQDIEQFLDAGAFAGRTASNANPKKALWIQNLTTEQRNELQSYWDAEVYGSAKMPIVGGEKAESIELGLVSDQNLFLSWQSFKIAVIASAFGIDVAKANVIAGLNRSTGDKMDDTTDEGAIKPLADRIATYITQYVLPMYGLSDVYEFRFIYTALSDQKSIATLNQVEAQDDTATIDECRFRQGKPPLLHPVTKESIGHMTLSAYREALKTPGFLARGIKALEEHAKRLDEQAQLAKEAKENADSDSGDANDGFENGENANNTKSNPDDRAGNGVYSAPKPREKAMNQRSDPSTDMT